MRRLAVIAAACTALLALPAAAATAHDSAEAASFVLVELRPSAGCDAPAILQRAGAETIAAPLRLYRLAGASAAGVTPELRACGALRFAAPDRTVGTLAVTDFADPLVPSEWWRPTVGVSDLTPPGAGKPVTIVDSGVNLTHPEFLNRPDLVALNPQEPQPLGGVHGTAVASLIGAPVNGVGIVGIYPQAVIQSWDAAVGMGTELTTSEIVSGILAAAERGPGVINISLGGNEPELPIQQAVATAVAKGMLVVAAAGNDGDRGSPLTYPASLPHVLTVAATDPQNLVAGFSSKSHFVDLAAPGTDMTVASALDQSWDSEDGTSFASPLVAGAAAWVWTVRPDLDASQLFEVMRRSATDIPPAGRDDASGYGLLSVPAALAYPAPVRDPREPNDDIAYVKPSGEFYNAIPPLTTRAASSATLTARLTVFEDPRDVYSVFLPANGRLTVRTTSDAGVNLTLWSRTATTVRGPVADRLARGTTQGTARTLTYRNPGRATTAYLAVAPAKGTREATYRLTVTAR